MFDDLPAPQMVGAIKIWPVHSRPEYKWFVAYDAKPHYFRTWNEAVLFAKDRQAMDDPEGLCD